MTQKFFFLRYIYTDEIQFNDDNLFDLVFAARKLKLNELEKQCSEFLKTKITKDNVAKFTEDALQFDSKDCTAICLDYFESNTKGVIESENFLKISSAVLGKLCESDKMNCTHVELFLACIEWAKEECKRNGTGTSPEDLRLALGEVLPKIKFSQMTLEEVMKNVVPTYVLTNESLGKIIYDLEKSPNVTVSLFS